VQNREQEKSDILRVGSEAQVVELLESDVVIGQMECHHMSEYGEGHANPGRSRMAGCRRFLAHFHLPECLLILMSPFVCGAVAMSDCRKLDCQGGNVSNDCGDRCTEQRLREVSPNSELRSLFRSCRVGDPGVLSTPAES